MKRRAALLASALLLSFVGPACDRSVGDDGDTTPQVSYKDAIRGCIHWSICNGFAGSVDFCDGEFEMFYTLLSPLEREALDSAYDCLSGAETCDEVAACDPGQCASMPTCEGDTLVTCVRGIEVRVVCGDVRTSGPHCLMADDGEATCGHRTCTPDDVARDSWCEGSTLLSCHRGVVEAQDCLATPGQPVCNDDQTYAGCADDAGETCDRETFVNHCDGSTIVECGLLLSRYDCSLFPHRSLCVEIDGALQCGSPEAATPCATMCAGNTLRYCAYDVSADVDCATFGMVCDSAGNVPTCR